MREIWKWEKERWVLLSPGQKTSDGETDVSGSAIDTLESYKTIEMI